MSKIQGKPFIELVVDTLGDLKTDFLDLVNGSDKTPEFRSLINASAKITDSDKGKVQYVVLETWSKTYTGYLIYNNTYCVLVAFSSNTQALTMLKIDVTKQTFITVKEYLDINELRRYLEEASEHITSGEIDSGEAQEGDILFADGDGGAEWGNLTDAIKEGSVDEGDVVQIFGFDSQGNLKKDDMPEGIVVDETIVEDSPNAVAGGAVYDALADIREDVDANTQALEEKANVDGNYPTMTVGAADNLTPYDEDSGTDQEQPFLLQGTGCGNGEQQVDTGALGLLKEKQGHSVVVNQLVNQANIPSSETVNTITFTYANGIMTINGSAASSTTFSTTQSVKLVAGHKYLKSKLTVPGATNSYIQVYDYINAENYQNDIFTAQYTVDGAYFRIRIENDLAVDNVKCYMYLIDLTQWFGSNDNIPAHLLAHPEDFFRYYQGSLAYNEGTLVNSNGRYLKTIGRNQWDEDIEGGYINVDTGANQSNDHAFRSKNYIRVVPNETYHIRRASAITGTCRVYEYDKDKNFISQQIVLATTGSDEEFTIASNTCYIRFATYLANSGWGENTPSKETAQTVISIYYEGEIGYDQYYPYEVLTNNDTGTEVLRSAGSVKDYKTPDGVVHRLVGNRAYQSGDENDSSLITDGTTTNYPLAEPTTEQGTPYSENLVIDDFGSMYFGGTNGVPQGASIFYAVDYKAFVDSLYNTLDGDATDVVKDSELDSKLATLGYVKLTSVSGYDVTKTQVLKNVEGTLTWVTEE